MYSDDEYSCVSDYRCRLWCVKSSIAPRRFHSLWTTGDVRSIVSAYLPSMVMTPPGVSYARVFTLSIFLISLMLTL